MAVAGWRLLLDFANDRGGNGDGPKGTGRAQRRRRRSVARPAGASFRRRRPGRTVRRPALDAAPRPSSADKGRAEIAIFTYVPISPHFTAVDSDIHPVTTLS